ncbi:MAG: DUF1800 domain-containing protein [Acidimicrobiales bacterium]
MPSSFQDIDHLLRRAGFAASRATIEALTPLDWSAAVDRVLDQSRVPAATVGTPNLDPARGHWERYVDMTRFWIERSRTIEIPLAEKMVLFWSGHFCSSMSKVGNHQLMFAQNQLFRTAGLGSFRSLLHQISLDPAMLIYLDNEQNRVGKANENFARELMELFTLGVGNYSEDDVRESARAWTGYGLNDAQQYVFSPSRHDNGDKTFFGTTRNWTGPEIIDHLLDGPKRELVAKFIATLVFEFFAHPAPSDATVATLANAFIASDWNIAALVRAVFMHADFRSPTARNGLLRSPFEFVVAALRHSGLTSAQVNPEWQLRVMGQEAYGPPNVAGWGQNDYWLTSASTWAKTYFASAIRWQSYSAETFSTIRNLSAAAATTYALEFFGIYNPSAKTLDAIYQAVRQERELVPYSSWTERAALLFLPLSTPEFQLA